MESTSATLEKSILVTALKYSKSCNIPKNGIIFVRWQVKFTKNAIKEKEDLEQQGKEKVILLLQLLVEDLKEKGPFPGVHWKNYSELSSKKNRDLRHCHLIKRKYVCCWEVFKSIHLIEVFYVGTHQNAPY